VVLSAALKHTAMKAVEMAVSVALLVSASISAPSDVAATQTVVSNGKPAAPPTGPTDDVVAAKTVIDDLNDHRAGSSERPLVIDPTLTQLAVDRGTDLVKRHYFAHVSPDGMTAIDDLRARGYKFSYAGENLAVAETVGAAEAGLWASPDHRDNIMEPHYRRVGIAVLHTPADGQYVVQIFSN
jgi:uncharacterized protein YkwD